MPAKRSSGKNSVTEARNSGSARYTPMKNIQKSGKDKKGGDPERLCHQLMPYILSILALFLFICYFLPSSTGFFGIFLKDAMFGLFSLAAWTVPFILVNIAVYWKRDVASGSLGYKFTFSFLCVTFAAVLIHSFAATGENPIPETYSLINLFTDGRTHIGGGMIGGFIGNLLLRGFGFAGTLILSIALILLFGIFLFGMTPHMLAVYITHGVKNLRSDWHDRVNDAEAEHEKRLGEYEAYRAAAKENAVVIKQDKRRKRRFIDPQLTVDDMEESLEGNSSKDKKKKKNIIDHDIFDEAASEGVTVDPDDQPPFDVEAETVVESDAPPFDPVPDEKKTGRFRREKVKPSPKTGMQELSEIEDGEIDLSKIFTDPEALTGEIAVPDMPEDGDVVTSAELDLMVEKSRLSGENAIITDDDFDLDEETSDSEDGGASFDKAGQLKIDYAFPPLSLLKFDRTTISSDMSSEIQQTATKLVETLRSFNVKTKIINVSRGPTITRYELQPEVGTKVRSIVNLVDDIALHLATSGVRIEAPIPGKEAVGIEVPNRTTSTVFIRELLEDNSFKSSKSKVTTGLGMDVAGNPVYLDIAKMPHMLIAGTTGSGKSVCINSLIISILYKARPDEVKFILIDPKKVELNIYNGIPHLLVPVVSDPKKAAGSLHWAVTEMERRYELIEGAGVRNIKGYNDSVANDPDAEKLPQIVIIIDELADLMMTAKDDVEEAICRIAQKARAAGMHLIIGTQRPSVDVITGLIKANVPSRIAFTTVSQVDSRTIIDIAGAEKLIGRGDMLFSPVGCIKPMRVQGAFVSDDEVDAVTTFVKNNYGIKDYDQSVIDTIEREAQLCGNKKATVLGDGDEEANDGDPMLKPAIQLAVESGKISTSLIQRRLQLGYGRAAKLIDTMEKMGIVGPPQGQKPRDVLISKQEYMEMELRRGE